MITPISQFSFTHQRIPFHIFFHVTRFVYFRFFFIIGLLAGRFPNSS